MQDKTPSSWDSEKGKDHEHESDHEHDHEHEHEHEHVHKHELNHYYHDHEKDAYKKHHGHGSDDKSERKEHDEMYHDRGCCGDDAHINARIPWWAGWGMPMGSYAGGRSGMGVTGMVLGIIAIALVVLFAFGWFERGERHEGRYKDRDGYYGDRDYGYHNGYGYGGREHYRDKYFEQGDKLAKVEAERYADHVGWRVLDKANDYCSKELNQYARFSKEIGEKDQLIAKLYTDRLFNKCVKEVPNLIESKQIVAPIGPVVNPPRFEMVPPPRPKPCSCPFDGCRCFDRDDRERERDRDKDRDRDRDRGDGRVSLVNW